MGGGGHRGCIGSGEVALGVGRENNGPAVELG